MKRWLYAWTTVRGRPDVLERTFLEEVPQLLVAATDATERQPAVDGSFEMKLASRVWTRDVTATVRVRVGVASHPDLRAVVPITWRAESAKAAFPVFDGAFELQPLGRGTSSLALVGAYVPPFGVVGAAVDSTLLADVAQSTAQRLVEAVAPQLESLVRADHDAAAPPPTTVRLRVRDVMTPDPLVVDADAPLQTAAHLLFHARISGAPVVDADGALVGVISERDLLVREATPTYGLGRRARDELRRRDAMTVGEACTTPARTTVPDALLTEAARTMLDHDVARLVVVDRSRVAGIVTRHDVLAALLRSDAAIVTAIETLLDEHDESDVTVRVAGGSVVLEGVTRLRTTAQTLPELVDSLDGVLSVESELRWRIDDVVPTTPYT